MRTVRPWTPVLAMLVIPLSLLVLLRLAVTLDRAFFDPHWHLAIVAPIAAMAAIVAFAAIVASRHSRHPGLTFLGVGAAGLAIAMLGHGLTTPGVHHQPVNAWVGRLPYVAIAVFTLGLFLGSRPVDHALGRFVTAHRAGVLTTSVGLLAAAVTVLVLDPSLLPPAAWEENAFDVLSVLVCVLCFGVVVVHWRRWQLGQDRVQLALAFSAAMTIAATFSLEHGRFTQLSWWDYHVYLLAGFGGAVYALVRRGRTSQAVTDILGDAFAEDPFDHIVRGYPEALRQLVKAVELKDSYTHGHSERTARIATALGLRMGLPAATLRVVARGAYLHDIGKIGIPDEILNKPGALDADERAVIETHPRLGYEIASGASSLSETLDVILRHHERFDGGGYPDGLAGTDVPIEARVVTVADVWDALTSDRSYRKGWSAARALAHITAGRGTHFDPRVVDAMIVLAADWGVTPDDEPGEPDAAWEATQTCHQVASGRELVGV